MFIYRDEVYNPESPDKGTAEIPIRSSERLDRFDAAPYMGQFTRFDNYAPEYTGGGDFRLRRGTTEPAPRSGSGFPSLPSGQVEPARQDACRVNLCA